MTVLRARHTGAKIAATLAVIFMLTGCTAAGPQTTPKPNPLSGIKLYVPPNSKAAQARDELEKAGRKADSDQIAKIAAQPSAIWLNGAKDDPAVVAQTMKAAESIGTVPTFVLYNIPHRDEGSGFSVHGAGDRAAYLDWLRQIDSRIGSDKAIVIVEPDALAAVATGAFKGDKNERIGLLREAVRIMGSHPDTYDYLDAGNSGWTQPKVMADLLREAGVDQARGISVNVSNFYTDDQAAGYGKQLSDLLDGAGVIIDRSRNGAGAQTPTDSLSWCNPPGRALGWPPVIGGPNDYVNAWLWVKPPGESDEACRPGAPPAGQFWVDYALELIKNKKQ